MHELLKNLACELNEYFKNTAFRSCAYASKFSKGRYGVSANTGAETIPVAFVDANAPYTYLRLNSPYTQFEKTTWNITRATMDCKIVAIMPTRKYETGDIEQSLFRLISQFVPTPTNAHSLQIEIIETTSSFEDIFFDEIDKEATNANVVLAECRFNVIAELGNCHIKQLPLIGECIEQPITYQPETVAFLQAINSTDATLAGAIDGLVVALKTGNLWSKFNAIYPFVGGTMDTTKYNLISPTDTDAGYRLTFVGAWQFDNNGVTGNGINTYARTHYIPTTAQPLGLNNTHLAFYSRTANAANAVDIGGYTRQQGTGAIIDALNVTANYAGNIYLGANSANTLAGVAVTPTTGLYVLSRVNSANVTLYRNGALLYNTALSSQLVCAAELYVGARNDNGIAMFSSNRQLAFVSIGGGLSATETATFNAAVTAFQTAMNRNV